ncbi:MAG: carbon monoxide dehydrogenase subunit G [Gammaproteobacteria bacterium]
MDIKGEYRIANARENVWLALNDPEILARCIPGCESMEKISDQEMRARVLAAIGPVKSRFDTTLTLEDLNPPASYRLVGVSKGGAAGFGKGSADVELVEEDEATLLRYSAQFKVGGKLAQVGSRLVLGATKKTADDFFQSFSREMDPNATRIEVEEAEPEGRPGTGRTTLIAVAAAVAVLILLWLLFGR